MGFKASSPVGQYAVVTGNYWAFTLTDGALRTLILLYFYDKGYTPFMLASIFILYEVFGVITNAVGGWLGARIGLNKTMNIGLVLQISAIVMLLAPATMLSVPWVMAAQALSGIAKDLNKMSAKSSIKSLTSAHEHQTTFKWVAKLTGSKNALKGVGFFLGGGLLTAVGFKGTLLILVALLLIALTFSLVALNKNLGKASSKIKFAQSFSKSRAINILSLARLFLFAARDVWFVIALPVYLSQSLGWNHWQVGAFLACWVIGYGFIQGFTPNFAFNRIKLARIPIYAGCWALTLASVPLILALTLTNFISFSTYANETITIIIGLSVFAGFFAVNSSLHSFLIVHFAKKDGASTDVGFYYMANASGRLLGTLLSGWVYQQWGMVTCLWVSTAFIITSGIIAFTLPKQTSPAAAHPLSG